MTHPDDNPQSRTRATSQRADFPVREAADFDDDGIDIRELLRAIGRRRWTILGVFVFLTVITALHVHQLTPRYTAEATLMLESRQSKVVDVEAVLSGLPANAAVMRTELDVLRSRSLLERVVSRLALHQERHIVPSIEEREPSLQEKLLAWLPTGDAGQNGWFSSNNNDNGDNPSVNDRPTPEQLRRAALENVSRNLEVRTDGQSYTIRLAFTSTSPDLAAEIVNTVADQYLVDQLEAKFEASRRANEWLMDQLERLRIEVQAAELAVQEYREQSGLIETQGMTVGDQQLAQLNAELVVARVARSQAEAQLRGARSGNIDEVPAVLASATVQRLKAEETSLRRRQAELSNRYGPRHPEMVRIAAELEDTQIRVGEEANRVIQSLANELEVARAKERALQSSLEELQRTSGVSLRATVQLQELERHAESARTLYENFLHRFRETGGQDELERPDARILTLADSPNDPSYPRYRQMMMGGGAIGLFLGLFLAFVQERLDRGFRQNEQVERITGLPVIGTVPEMSGHGMEPQHYVLKKPMSALAESLRAIRTTVQLSRVDTPVKTVVVTSALPEEGKTTVVTTLARVVAMSGARVLVIDADLRRPQIAQAMGVEPGQTLTDVLSGEGELRSAVVRDPDSDVHILASRPYSGSGSDLLGSQRMATLLSTLRNHYDLVLIDTPPILAVIDAGTVARQVDAVLLAARWADTPRETVVAALRQLATLDVDVAGIVLSRVDLRKQARYGYGDYGYFYGRYKNYYAN